MPSPAPKRVNLLLSGEAVQWLESEAKRRAITVSEMIRRIVDEARDSYIVPPSQRPQLLRRG